LMRRTGDLAEDNEDVYPLFTERNILNLNE